MSVTSGNIAGVIAVLPATMPLAGTAGDAGSVCDEAPKVAASRAGVGAPNSVRASDLSLARRIRDSSLIASSE
ncbi:hypothetical protein ACS0ZG_37365, partial [Burkholderia gladioli]